MSWILQKISEDWKAKLVSLLLAGIFWVYVQDLQFDSVNLSVPVEYIHLPNKLFWKVEPPRFVKLTVRGKKEDTKFPTSNLKAVVDLNEAKTGLHTYHILFDKNQIPDKVSVISFKDTIKIDFDRGIQKMVQVKPFIQGEVPAGYKIGRIIINPSKVIVEGAAEFLNNIRTVNTRPIIISDLKETFTFHTQISSENQFKMINVSDLEVTVTVYKQDTTNERLVENIKIDILGKDPALNASLSTNTVKAYVRGEVEDLKKIDPNQFHAYINLDGTRFIARTMNILPFDYEPDILVNIKNLYKDNNIEILELIPATVSVRFSVKPEFLKKMDDTTIKENKQNADSNTEDNSKLK
ncbi:MAG: CdaR family protein [Spirochaetia bacterium]|nr:CdaR family protein [Spirochaetia bacterium]